MRDKINLVVGVLLVGILACVFYFGVPTRVSPDKGTIVGGNYRENTKEIAILTATSSPANVRATSTMESVVYYRNLGITLATGNASGTLKFYCSLYDSQPSLYDPKGLTNPYDTVEVIDTQNGVTIDGDTGITLNNTTDVRQFEINGNNFRWCGAALSETDTPSGYGTTTVRFKPADNQ